MVATSTSPAASPATRTVWQRRVLGLLLLTALLVIAVILSLAVGTRTMPVGTAIDGLLAIPDTLRSPDGVSNDFRVIADLRFPRTLIGLIVGAALGVAGALIQGHTRNPLADPAILGVSAGAALAVVTSFAFLGVTSMFATSLWAFCGAMVATGIVFALAAVGGGRLNPLTLILGGAALSAVLSSVTSALVLLDNDNLDRMRFWTVGALTGRGLDVFWGTLPLVAIGLIAAFATGPTLNLLNLGDDVASSLGVDTQRARTFGMLIIALLAGAATAAAGPVGFLGLVIPHIVRSITGPDYRWILPYSALAGAVLLLYADIVGRIIVRPGELEVGIVLAFVGAPFFIALIYRQKVAKL